MLCHQWIHGVAWFRNRYITHIQEACQAGKRAVSRPSRIRRRTTSTSTRTVKRNLPKSCYHRRYLQSLIPSALAIVRPCDEPIPLFSDWADRMNSDSEDMDESWGFLTRTPVTCLRRPPDATTVFCLCQKLVFSFHFLSSQRRSQYFTFQLLFILQQNTSFQYAYLNGWNWCFCLE